ncbi:hypothetical protein BCR44DRAFT_54811 [Catenaria anguillulae PL171]|uniref:Ricin B lectin domain-containing protein n=1 Tax=Catenaria anguillulae PL171 TaxID=765915 RepID=A0A1Y2HZ57_9FUNG|nr:hypothetical protein BCR44DRAFT_54811 [Catenaria anguillulae PL171]
MASAVHIRDNSTVPVTAPVSQAGHITSIDMRALNATPLVVPGRRNRRGDKEFGFFPFCIHFYQTFGQPSDRSACLDVEQSRQKRWTADAQLWSCYGNAKAQKFIGHHVYEGKSFGHPNYPNSELSIGWYTISAENGKYCLDVPGGDKFSGQTVRWWECNGSMAQVWHMWHLQAGPNYWEVKTFISPYGQLYRLCLDAMGDHYFFSFAQPSARAHSLVVMRQPTSLMALLAIAALLIVQLVHAAPARDETSLGVASPTGGNVTVNDAAPSADQGRDNARNRPVAGITIAPQAKSPLATATPGPGLATARRGAPEGHTSLETRGTPYCLRPFHKNPDGWGNMCLDVEQSRQNDETAEAQIWGCNGNERAQRIFFDVSTYMVDDGQFGRYAYRITADTWRYCLDVPGGNAFAGQRVRWWKCNGSSAQAWFHFRDPGSGDSFWKPFTNPKLCLDALGGSGQRGHGQQVGLWHCHFGPGQNFEEYLWDKPGCRW